MKSSLIAPPPQTALSATTIAFHRVQSGSPRTARHTVPDQETVQKKCLLAVPHLACAFRFGKYCVILLTPPEQYELQGYTREKILRHEIGHCNGWGSDHRGGGAVGCGLPQRRIPFAAQWRREGWVASATRSDYKKRVERPDFDPSAVGLARRCEKRGLWPDFEEESHVRRRTDGERQSRHR